VKEFKNVPFGTVALKQETSGNSPSLIPYPGHPVEQFYGAERK